MLISNCDNHQSEQEKNTRIRSCLNPFAVEGPPAGYRGGHPIPC